jgi:hypothetical protein
MNVTGSVNEEGGVQDGEVVVQQAELVHLSHFILKFLFWKCKVNSKKNVIIVAYQIIACQHLIK